MAKPKTVVNNRPSITKRLSDLTEWHINPMNDPRIYMAKEITFDYGTAHSVRVDYMQFKPVNNTVSGIEKGDFYCYEIKSSVEDYKSKNGHNMIGDYNYYVMPESVYQSIKETIPYKIGVLCPIGEDWLNVNTRLVSVKKAHRSDRNRPLSEMLLMMYRSAAREIRKEVKETNDR